jgi:hypothetical protein
MRPGRLSGMTGVQPVPLLDEVIAAHGGMNLWAGLRRFTLHTSIDGELLSRKGKAGVCKDVVISGHTQDQYLWIAGFPAADKRGVYRPDRVTIETLDGTTLEERDNPRQAFAGHDDQTPWDDLHLAYYCGYAIWSGVTAPFLFAGPDFKVQELGPWQVSGGQASGETWNRLHVVFPPDVVSHCSEQTLYFDQIGLQRRVDFLETDAGGTSIARHSWAHETFSGIVVPSLQRATRLGSDGIAIAKPAYIDIEIFDARFE